MLTLELKKKTFFFGYPVRIGSWYAVKSHAYRAQLNLRADRK